MALGFSTYQRLERMLLRTRSILGETTDDTFREANKAQALQMAAALYDLYDGDGSETTYTDSTTLSVLQSELIATVAAIELLNSAISYYKDGVITANGGPASVSFRTDKLAWLTKQIDLLKEKLALIEDALGYSETGDIPGLILEKVRACCDPADDVCDDDCNISTTFEETI